MSYKGCILKLIKENLILKFFDARNLLSIYFFHRRLVRAVRPVPEAIEDNFRRQEVVGPIHILTLCL